MSKTFRNPVVRGVAPDPSVCRVGDDFYLANSSFEYWPGTPIRHSTDLVHWRLIGHAVTRPLQARKDGDPDLPFVLFAPTLRHSGGKFFLACTNVAPVEPTPGWFNDGLGVQGRSVGNFVVHSEDPAGTWSDASWIDEEAFDPSLAFLDDTCYYTRRSFDLGDPRGLGPIVQAEIEPLSGRLHSPPRPILPGRTGFLSNDIEGPHLYRIGRWYYLFAAEGGTYHGHMQTCGRSRSPWGPFEPAPHNPVLTHRHLVMNPIQRTGHAELIDAPDGSWWALFLGVRPGPGGVVLGRETFLAPVTWRDGWPVIGADGVVEMSMPAPGLPEQIGEQGAPRSAWLAGWSTRQFPVPGLRIDGTAITLPVTAEPLDGLQSVGAVFLRQQEHRASFRATVGAVPAGVRAGICAYTGPEHHYQLLSVSADGERRILLRRRAADLIAETWVGLPGDDPVELLVECDGATYRFSARSSGRYVPVGSGVAKLLDPDSAPGFGSVRLGVVAVGQPGGVVVFTAVSGQDVG